MKPYEKYASVYDRSGQILFSLRLIPYMDEVLEKHFFKGNSMLDLASGTGTLVLAFANKGFKAFGIDSSPAMIEQSEIKAREDGPTAHFDQQDMRSFRLSEMVDLVTCFNDSLNYLEGLPDLQATVSSVGGVLKPGGLFVFDFLTPRSLKEVWRDETAFFDDGDLALILRTLYDAKADRTVLTVTGFVRRGDYYERFVERHPLLGFSFLEMTCALEAAGLRVEATYKFFTLLDDFGETEKLLWVARKL